MPEEARLINGGLQARQNYASSLEAERLRVAAEHIVNPVAAVEPMPVSLSTPVQTIEYADIPHTAFPFDKEEPHMQAMTATPAIAGVGATAAFGIGEVAGKGSIFASISAAMAQVGLPIVATILIGGGIGLGVVSIMNNIAVQNQVKNFATEASNSGQTGNSSAFVPSTNPKEPVKVEIPDLSISADTTKVGTDNKNNIGSPANIKQLAWYQNSSSPADSVGTALIVGHVGTSTYGGAFADLYKIKNDATVKLTMGDGATELYKVSKVEDIAADKVDMADYLPQEGQTDKKLVLITCTGDYNSNTYSYADRLIVTASAVQH